MKTHKLSLLTISILSSILSINISAADLTTSSVNAFIYFDDTDNAGNEWKISGNTSYWYLKDENSNGVVMRYAQSNNNNLSFDVDSSGDINLANGSVFIDRSANLMGIGTTAPEQALHVASGNGNMILEWTGLSKWELGTLSDGGFWLRNQTSATVPFRIYGDAVDNNLVLQSGYVGIGTNTPQEKLDVYNEEDGARLVLTTVGANTYDAPQFTSRRAGSDGSGNPENTKNGDVIGSFAWRGHDGTDWTGAKALFWVRADGDWNSSSTGTNVEIRQTPQNSTTALIALQIKNHADVYIPNGNLYVKGSKMNVPDYVFDKDYKLMPLAELEKYISTNKHLPGVQSAEEIGKEGVVNLSGLQMTLLEKVEELTLYTLKQEKALAQKVQQIKLMEEKINKLEAMQKRLSKVESLLTNLAVDTSCKQSKKVSFNLK